MDSSVSSLGNEVQKLELEDSDTQPSTEHTVIKLNGDEFWPLSGKPYFDVILGKSHLKPQYNVWIPAHFQHILPSLVIPTFLVYQDKTWEMVYNGATAWKRIQSGWKNFVNDNNLKTGDACVFELMECTQKEIKFRVMILRGDLPSKFSNKVDGEDEDTPIIIE